jgi:hypothetical protein
MTVVLDARGGPDFEGLGLLAAGDLDCLLEERLGFLVAVIGHP